MIGQALVGVNKKRRKKKAQNYVESWDFTIL